MVTIGFVMVLDRDITESDGTIEVGVRLEQKVAVSVTVDIRAVNEWNSSRGRRSVLCRLASCVSNDAEKHESNQPFSRKKLWNGISCCNVPGEVYYRS